MAARKRSGFTLIELLVVIAIIAILAAILFPVFARAREQGRKSTCSSNMHECGIAVTTYIGDYDSTLPSSAIVATVAGHAVPATPQAADQTKFLTGLNATAPNGTGLRQSWAQIIYDCMKNKGIVFCPSDSVSADNWVTGTSALSYWWKTAADTAWFGGTSGGVTVTKCQKESDFGYTADQVLIYEHSGFHTGDMVLKDGVQINICFMDSHVKTTPLRLCQASAATTYPAPGQVVTGGNAYGEPMYYNHYAGTDTALEADYAATAVHFNSRTDLDKF